ncbi:MAG: DNA polymerase III subunit delta [Lachnospiraceae bacterium]|nr:DNA polymerase III subunit delta [Lachnospiraceae bacterium]
MQKLKADLDIESGKFEKVYLLYGDEPYLVRTYKNKLKKAIIPEAESMNYAYFESMPENVETITSFTDTLPFFGDRRLVILDKTNAFKKDTGLADYIQDIPDFSTMIIVEDEIDKRSRLYKAISKYGCIMELKKLTLQDLKIFIASRLKAADKRITESDCEYLIQSVGDDLNSLMNEADKCIAYAGDSNVVDKRVINSVCSMQVENKIFDMVDAILQHNGNTVFKLYGDLVTLRENSFGIMAVIRMNYNRLLKVRELYEDGVSPAEIGVRCKMADWLVKKQIQKIRNYDSNRLKKALEIIVDTEYAIKIGNLQEQMGLEIMLAKLLEL